MDRILIWIIFLVDLRLYYTPYLVIDSADGNQGPSHEKASADRPAGMGFIQLNRGSLIPRSTVGLQRRIAE